MQRTTVNYQCQTQNRYCSVFSITLHLTCAFQVNKWKKNERVIALFCQFSYNFYISLKSVKHHNFNTPCCMDFTNIDYFNLYFGRVYKLTINKRLAKQWLKFKDGSGFILLAKYVSRNGLIIGALI